MSSLKTRVARLEQSAVQHQELPSDCICFPAREPVTFGSQEELDMAAAVRCPIHGERFDAGSAFVVYKSAWRREREEDSVPPHASPQFQKAMRASKVVDR